MPLSGDDHICPKFQPNIFDSSRCHDCLRQKHLHSGTSTGTGTAETPQLSLTTEKEPGQGTGPPPTLLPAPQAVERDASAKESDGLSVVSSYCDVSRDQLGNEESSLCILSPDCDLYICDGDDNDSTDSCRDQSVYADLSGSVSAEDDYLPLWHRSTHLTMTRLDPPPHRTNPKAWMEEANSRGRIGRHSGLKEERNRESGYFSLGRAGGARSLRDQSPPPVYRHSERGHPLYSNRSPEPKATIPFRNPNLGLASERLNPEILNPDLPLKIPEPPDLFDLTIEVEAQVGPRSPSPTPFKIAESLASTNRRGFNSSYSIRNSYQESGMFNLPRQGSLLSRSSSPSQSTSPFKRSECTTPLNRWGLDSEGWSQGRDQTSIGPPQSSYRRGVDFRSLNKNVILMASSVGSISQANSVANFKSALRKNETDSSLNGRGCDSRSSAPSRRGYESPRQSLVRKSETSNSFNGRDSRSSPPLRKAYDTSSQTLLRKSDGNSSINGCESRNSSPSRRSYDTTSQSLLRKSETNSSLNGHSRHGGRCGSPIREGYDAERQSLLKSDSRNDLNAHAYESGSSSPSRRGFDTPCQSLLRKSETSGCGNGRGRDSRSSSPSRKGYDAPGQSLLRKSETNSSVRSQSRDRPTHSPSRRGYDAPSQSSLRKSESSKYLNSQSRDSRSSSPSRKGYDAPGQSLLRKSETNSSVRSQSRDRPTHSPSRRGYDAPSQSSLRKSESSKYLNSQSRDSRSSSPSRKGYDAPGQSLLRKSETNSSVRSQSRDCPTHSPSRRGYDAPSQSSLRKSESNNFLNSQSRDSQSSSPSRKGYDAPDQSLLRKSETNSSVRSQSRDRPTHSPSRRGYDAPSQSSLRKSESNNYLNSQSRDSQSSSPSRKGYDAPGQSLLCKSETNSSVRCQSRDSRNSSPSRRGHDTPSQSLLHISEKSGALNSHISSPSKRGNDPPGQSLLRKTTSGGSLSYQRKSTYGDARPDSNPSPGSWRGSTHFLHSTSPSIEGKENRTPAPSQRASAVTWDTTRSSSSRQGLETRSSSPNSQRLTNCNRSPSPQMQRHTSSQSSMESSESGQLSGESTDRNKEEYAMMADLPKVKPDQRERLGHVGQTPNQPSGRQELFKPAREWLDDSGELEGNHIGWQNGSSGRLSRAHSSTSLHMQRPSSPTIEEEASPRRAYHSASLEQMQPDLLNFKKGWMSKLDENGEWKKHWFVLTDAGLRYYRDSGAEEKDDLDGEIDLKSCVKVSEFDVEKNYGFQIQTRETVVTLSAMTAGIRRNWIEVLRKSVRPSSSPDLTQLPDSSSDKENSRSLASTRRQSSRHGDAGSEITTATVHRFDCVKLSPVPVPSSPLPGTQREAGEGQGREHAQWQEERSRDVTSSTWEQVLSRKGLGVGSNPRIRAEEDIERKWAEFERLPLKEMKSLLPMGSRSSQPANEALQREVASLRQQLERLQGGGGRVGGGICGLEAMCGRSLQAMERAHKQALEELQKQHARETRELERNRDRLLREETQDTAQVMETLKKAHMEELEREVEKAKRLGGGSANTQTLRTQQQVETQALQRELSGLSERYSQKCLELNRAEQSNGEREKDLTLKESELEQLRKENQDLQARLTEEISRMRSIVKGQGSEGVSHDNQDRLSCELEVLLKVKEIEVQYLHKEISCLRNELQFLNTEKQSACERFKEVHGELRGVKSRSEREIQSLREHLRLAMVALQEGQKLGNSLEH